MYENINNLESRYLQYSIVQGIAQIDIRIAQKCKRKTKKNCREKEIYIYKIPKIRENKNFVYSI